MNMTHLQPFLDAMHAGDFEAAADHMSDGVLLRSPILVEPFVGRDAVRRLLAVLLQAADSFEVTDMVTADTRALVFVTIRSGDVVVDGIDDMRVNADGLVSSMTVQWRPLPAIVAMQRRIAPFAGLPLLELVQR